MNGMTMFLLGTVALTNVALVAYLLGERNRNIKPPDSESQQKDSDSQEPPSDEKQSKPEADKSAAKQTEVKQENDSRIGKSTFDVDEFLKKFESLEQDLIRLNRTVDRLEGDVKLNEVEFANKEDIPSAEEIAKDSAKETSSNVETSAADAATKENDAQVPSNQLDSTFTDVRIEDVDGDEVSSPSATGSTFEDIEESYETVSNPDATPEERKKAGKVLYPLLDTNLLERAADKIRNEVIECFREYVRDGIAEKSSRQVQPRQKAKPLDSKLSEALPQKDSQSSDAVMAKSETVPPKKSDFHIAKDIKDFNPEDLIRK